MRSGPASGPPFGRNKPQRSDNRAPRDDNGRRFPWHIVHEDEHVVVVDKPPHLPVVLPPGAPKHLPSLAVGLRRAIKGGPSGSRPMLWTVHPLETEAAGLVVLARTPAARDALRQQAATGQLRRTLTGVVEGVPPGDRVGAVRFKLVERPNGSVVALTGDAYSVIELNRARDATTHYQLLRTDGRRSILRLRDDTGRRGQLPAHLRAIGCQLIGDEAPNPRKRRGGPHERPPKLALHGTDLSFVHPFTGDTMRFHADPAPGMLALVGEERQPHAREQGREQPRSDREPLKQPSAQNPSAETPIPHTPKPPTPKPLEPTPLPEWRPSGEGAHAAHLEPIGGFSEPSTPPAAAPDSTSAKSPEPASSGSPQPDAGPVDHVSTEPEAPIGETPPSAPLADDRGWHHVASWYDQLLEDRTSDLYEQVVLPGAERLLGPVAGAQVIDIACGQGVLSRRLHAEGARVVGVDAAPGLIEAAKGRSDPAIDYRVGDARKLGALGLRAASFDAAACVMALMNIEPLAPAVRSAAALLRPGGVFVAVILHPAFRAPQTSNWYWRPDIEPHQVREVAAYLSPAQAAITMNPGAVARGAEPVLTWTYHRPIGQYVQELAAAGFLVDAMEEWASPRRSRPGPRSNEENRARAEIPMFLALRAVKRDPDLA